MDLTGESPRLSRPAIAHEGPIESLNWLPAAGAIASCGRDARVCLWQLPTEQAAAEDPSALQPHRVRRADLYTSLAAALAPDNQVLAVAGSGSGAPILIGDPVAKTWPSVRVPSGHRGAIVALAYSSDGRWLASAGRPSGRQSSQVRLWRNGARGLRFEKVLFELPREAGALKSVAFAPHRALLAVAGQDRRLRIWNLDEEGGEPVVLPLDTELGPVVFSPDGSRCAVGGRNRRVYVWSLEGDEPVLVDTFAPLTGRLILSVGMQFTPVRLSFSPDGGTLAVTVTGVLYLWQPESEAEPVEWRFPGDIHSLRFLPDGRHLLTGNSNGTIYALRFDDAAGDSSND